ncbi:MAG: hypothetical protein A2054_00680 [Deltaproteobacteria bacterium GWA2_55_10]|nr:MAG: hypothetical protein A2054_00680 [Deltaproteobacteria bacterium GWA2_55_10]
MKGAQDKLLQRAFNLRFGLKLCLITLLGGAGLLALLYLSLDADVGGSYTQAIYTIYDLKLRILPLIFASSYSMLVLAVVAIAVAVISVLYSHKIAGPIFRLERNMEQIGSGDLTVSTRFRGGDQLSLLADDLNSMVRSLNHTARSATEALEAMRRSEDALKDLLAKEYPREEELRAAVDDLRRSLVELKRTVSNIRTSEGA